MYRQPIRQLPIVLVVDHSQQLRVPVQEAFSPRDFDIVIAEDDQAAHELLAQITPDAILIDIDRPSGHNVELAHTSAGFLNTRIPRSSSQQQTTTPPPSTMPMQPGQLILLPSRFMGFSCGIDSDTS